MIKVSRNPPAKELRKGESQRDSRQRIFIDKL